ncbi:cupin domain-containing protein [Geodermatophilus sp. SYSU D00815]
MPVVRAGQLDYVRLPGRLSADPMPAGLAVGASARVVRIAPGPRTPHVHPHSAEVVYVASGTGTAWEDDVPSAVAAGDLVVVPPGVPHATVASGTSDLVLVCFFPHPDLRANLRELPGPERTAL